MRIKIIIFFFILGFGAYAQQGIIKGIISDAENSETLVGVTIAIYPSSDSLLMLTGTSTDLDGNYSLPLDEGNYKFKISYVSYQALDEQIHIKAGETFEHHIQLSGSSFELKAVEVIARTNRESEGVLLMDQKKTTSIEQSIGSKELSRKGASDAAAGVKKVSGVSMVGSRQLFVRGLGDRYNSAQLNGMPISSPDPNKKLIKLDVFQTDIIQYLKVSKAYNAKNYADYTGALIDISTKEYPEEAFLSFGVGGKYNTQSTFNEFMRINANGNRFMGLDVAERGKLTPDKYRVAKKKTQFVDQDFNYASYGFSNNSATPYIDLSVSGGKLFQLNEKRKLGGVFSLSFNNEYFNTPNITELQVNKQNIKDGDFISDKYSYNSYLSALGSISYIHNKENSISYHLVFLNNGIDSYKEKTGTKPDWKNANETVLIRNAQYINYRLLNNQISGKHQLSDLFKLNWKANYSLSQYNMPDRREVVYWTQQAMDAPLGEKEWGYMTYDKGLASKRLITEQNTHDINFSINLQYQLYDKGELVIGGAARQLSLSYRSYFYGYSFVAGQAGNLSLPVDIQNPDAYFGSDYLEKVTNNSSDQMGYDGASSIYAAYADFIYSLSEKFSINAGVRMEMSNMDITPNMNVNDGNEETISFNNLDFFPALNIKYAANENMNIRLAVSRSVTRPGFYEKSPALIIPETGENRFVGNTGTKENPNDFGFYLENAYSQNLELKWELFPNPNELISFAAFGKIIHDPIENISYIQGGTDKTYSVRNFPDKATVAGLEFEIKKQFQHVFAGLNLAYIYSKIDIPETANELNSSRALQGASPYLINADLGYLLKYGSQEDKSSYFGVVYNVYGKRLFVVGINEGNQYQLPFNSLDLILKNKLSSKLNIDFSIKNLLNSKYIIVQDVYEDMNNPELKTNEIITKEFTTGISVGISLKYKI